MLETSYPVENGIVKDWAGMKNVWDYTFFEKMKVDPKEHKVLLTEPPMNPISNQKHMYEHMFETYGFKAAKVRHTQQQQHTRPKTHTETYNR